MVVLKINNCTIGDKMLFFLLKRFYLLTFLLSGTLTATLYQLTLVTLESGQVFYLFSERHSNEETELNKKQLESFISLLKKAENLPVKVRVFLEKASLSVVEGYAWDPCIITKAIELTKDLGLKNSALVNIDIRKIAGAAIAILGCCTSYDGQSICFTSYQTIMNSLESYGCKLDRFTFLDLLNELEGYCHILSEYKNRCPNKKLVFAFELGLTFCKGEIAYLKSLMGECKIKATECFIDFLIQIAAKSNKEECFAKMLDLFTAILQTSSTLMDLYTVSRLVKSEENNEKVVVIAGGDHINSIASILSLAYPNARQEIISQEPFPLGEHIFDKILEPRG